jgi:cytochrome P450
MSLLVAGFVTSLNLVANGFGALLGNPEQLRRTC